MEEALDQTGALTVVQLLAALNKWLVGTDILWGQGYGFDYNILENMYRSVETPTPWSFWQIRDSRTLFGLLPSDPRKTMQTDLHNAYADAYYQSKAIQIAYKELGL